MSGRQRRVGRSPCSGTTRSCPRSGEQAGTGSPASVGARGCPHRGPERERELRRRRPRRCRWPAVLMICLRGSSVRLPAATDVPSAWGSRRPRCSTSARLGRRTPRARFDCRPLRRCRRCRRPPSAPASDVPRQTPTTVSKSEPTVSAARRAVGRWRVAEPDRVAQRCARRRGARHPRSPALRVSRLAAGEWRQAPMTVACTEVFVGRGGAHRGEQVDRQAARRHVPAGSGSR